jgi:hypothetical protein
MERRKSLVLISIKVMSALFKKEQQSSMTRKHKPPT